MDRQQNRAIAILLALLLVVAQTLPSLAQSDPPAPAADPSIRIGTVSSVEGTLLASMMVMLLEEAGYVVETDSLSSQADARAALLDDQIDLYVEYTGLALINYNDLPVEALPNVAERVYELAKTLDEPRGIEWLEPAPMNGALTLLVTQSTADSGITTIDELADAINADSEAYTICIEGDFYARVDGLQALEAYYGMSFPEENILIMESDEVYSNLLSDNCTVAQGYSTDGRITAWDFVPLTDTQNAFHFDQPVPVARAELLETYPELVSLFEPLMLLLDTDTMSNLNARVLLGDDGALNSGDEEAAADVVLAYMTNNGLLRPAPIRVGSKEFTEQLILGKLLVLLLRDAGFEVEDMTGAGGTALIRQMIENGEIDIYPEYTGTATSVHHGIPVTALPTTAERAYVLAKSLDAPQGLVWLNRMAFNNTYTLLVRQELVDEGIQTIDDLAVYMNANDAPLTICLEGEFYARPDGLDGLQSLYGFAFQEENIFVIEIGDVYEKLRAGECDVAEGFSTDGRINAWNFVALDDSLAFFPFYNPTPVVRKEVLDLHPELVGILNQLSPLLTESAMAALNAQVDIGPDGELASGDEIDAEEAAYNFLRLNRLVALPEINVAATNATEGFQTILSNMLMLVLADAGYQPVDKTELGGNLAVREAMLRDEVDIYIETVVTALSEYHNLPVAALPTTQERAYALAQNLDRENNIVWLDMLPYAETVALIEGENLAELGITAIDDLALYMIANDAPLSICMSNEFFGSELYGIDALQQLYGFEFLPENILLMGDEDILAGMDSGECDVAAANSLDARSRGYTVLDDPLDFFLASGSAPVVRKDVLDQNPELAETINSVIALLDADTVGELDRLVELGPDGEEENGDEAESYDVARDFLVDNGLIAPPAEPASEENSDSENADASSSAEDVSVNAPTDEEAPPADEPAVEDGEGETGQNPASPESPSLTQSSPSVERGTSAMTTAGREGNAVTTTPPVPPRVIQDSGIVVASMRDTEQQLIGQMLLTMLQSAGYPVVDQTASGTSPDLRVMLERGEIDLYPEFTGVALSLYHNIPPSALPTTADGAFSLVKDLDGALGFIWIRKASFDSAYGLAATPAAVEAGMRTLLDMAALLQRDPTALTLCVDEDFLDESEMGLDALAALYEFELSQENIVVLTADEIYRSLRDGTCDIGKILQTDGRISAWNLVVLDDPLGAFPTYAPAPVVRSAVLEIYPELEEYLATLGPMLSPEIMSALNAQVELGTDGEPETGDEAELTAVATTFLCENQLVTCSTSTAETLTTKDQAGVTSEITPVLTLIPIADDGGVSEAPADESSDSDQTNASEADGADTPVVDTFENTAMNTTTVPAETNATDAENATGQAEDDITVSTPVTFGVNARDRADATATVVAILPKDTTIEAIGRSADSSWLQIRTDTGEVAWVFTAAVISNPQRIGTLPVTTTE